MNIDYSKFPSMDALLSEVNLLYKNKIAQIFLKELIQRTVSEIKERPARYNITDLKREQIKKLILDIVEEKISNLLSPSFKKVINGTGVILHTGLGRAPLGKEILNVLECIDGYTNLEFNLSTGKRGERLDHATHLLQLITGAENSVVVNNNAAAVLLTLNSLARRKEVIVSRGELVEIGGSFRLPEVMKNSGSKMVEVGATNKTHLRDYEEALTDRTAAIMIVHPSNYKIIGFTQRPEAKEILTLAHNNGIPVIFDLGSGAFIDMTRFGFEYEPVVRDVISLGFDVVSFSGDKLLGGPQAGIIVGKTAYLSKIRKNHLLRALRCDKITLALLNHTLVHYLNPASIHKNNSTIRLFSRTKEYLRAQSAKLLSFIDRDKQDHLEIVEAEGRAGSGAYPVYPIPSLAIRITSQNKSAEKISKLFRDQNTPVIGYIEGDSFHLNLLTLAEDDLPIIADYLNTIL